MATDKIDHISIAVRDLAQARAQWEPVLGRDGPDELYEDAAEQIRVARYYLGEVGLELMESTHPDGEVARFIDQRGEGVMLLSLAVDHCDRACDALAQQGYPIVGPSRPFRGGRFNFIHPKQMNQVLVELIDDGQDPT